MLPQAKAALCASCTGEQTAKQYYMRSLADFGLFQQILIKTK
jgi:hypothetical protein